MGRGSAWSWLHHQGEAGEFFLHALEVAADGLEPGGCGASLGAGNAVAATAKEGADELAGLPGVKAGLPEFFAERGEIGGREGLGSGYQGRPLRYAGSFPGLVAD